MDALIHPLKESTVKEVSMPGSKSYTNRALVMASLAKGKSKLTHVSESEDSKTLVKALGKLGVNIQKGKDSLEVMGRGGKFKAYSGRIQVGHAGTAMRFLTSLACIAPCTVTLMGSERMHNRPIGELVEGLKQLGANITYQEKISFPPIKIQGGHIRGGSVELNGEVSSQYFTSLLLIAPLLREGLHIKVKGKQVSSSYIDMTISGLKAFGITVKNNDYMSYTVSPGQTYKSTTYAIEGDASGASYIWGIAALTRSRIKVKHIPPSSRQGDAAFPDVLKKMGCKVKKHEKEQWIEVQGGTRLLPIKVNMEHMPDSAQTLAVIAAFAKGKSQISGLSTLQSKETERITALKNELRKMEIPCQSTNDSITIHGGTPKGARISTYGDHRMAMAFAVAGAKIEGVKIENPQVVNKSFPEFWQTLNDIGVRTKLYR